MASRDVSPDPNRVLLCPECEQEQAGPEALFRHLAEAHPQTVHGKPPKAPRKPKSEKKGKLTWKEQALREMERREARKQRPQKKTPAEPPAAAAKPAEPQPAPALERPPAGVARTAPE
ncbi:MAG TPA: hypothetical protein VNZ52_13675, partial [Candidatus Thermoplasmatota archaeon]|nr:hypothetical protein [Candidatus Thermoplasmatota archaeon]